MVVMQNTHKDGKKFFTVSTAAEFLGVTAKTIRRWAQKNILPGLKVGPRGDWRFTDQDLLGMVKRKGVERYDHSRK